MKGFIAIFVVLAAILGAFAAPQTKITGGSNAARNQFPYQVSMQWGLIGIWQHICGGSILTPTRVVTAAHCITESPTLGSFRIIAGLLNLNDVGNFIETVAVTSSVVHPDYQGGVNPNDIAMLNLAFQLTWSDAVGPIGLPVAGSIPIGNSVLSGWGSTSTTALPSMPNTLQTVTIPVITNTQCATALIALLGSSTPLAATNVCTGPLDAQISACSGDSGGPLTQGGALIGIVSWGIFPCGTIGAPSVYTRVSAFIPWINSNL